MRFFLWSAFNQTRPSLIYLFSGYSWHFHMLRSYCSIQTHILVVKLKERTRVGVSGALNATCLFYFEFHGPQVGNECNVVNITHRFKHKAVETQMKNHVGSKSITYPLNLQVPSSCCFWNTRHRSRALSCYAFAYINILALEGTASCCQADLSAVCHCWVTVTNLDTSSQS